MEWWRLKQFSFADPLKNIIAHFSFSAPCTCPRKWLCCYIRSSIYLFNWELVRCTYPAWSNVSRTTRPPQHRMLLPRPICPFRASGCLDGERDHSRTVTAPAGCDHLVAAVAVKQRCRRPRLPKEGHWPLVRSALNLAVHFWFRLCFEHFLFWIIWFR
jgi:hypothetical protein